MVDDNDQNLVDIYNQNVVDIYSQDVMDFSRNKSRRDDKNKMEILDIFQHMNSKLPEGCQVIEGYIQIEFPDQSNKTHGFRKKNQLPKHDTKYTMTKDDLLQICHEVQKLSKHLYRGWRFTRIIISKDDHLYDILEGLARMTKGSKHSQRMDNQRDWSQKEYMANGWKSKSGSGKTNKPKDIINVSYTADDTKYVEDQYDNENEEDHKKCIS